MILTVVVAHAASPFVRPDPPSPRGRTPIDRASGSRPAPNLRALLCPTAPPGPAEPAVGSSPCCGAWRSAREKCSAAQPLQAHEAAETESVDRGPGHRLAHRRQEWGESRGRWRHPSEARRLRATSRPWDRLERLQSPLAVRCVNADRGGDTLIVTAPVVELGTYPLGPLPRLPFD